MQRWRAVIKSHLKHFSVSWRYLLFKIHCGRLKILNMSAVYLASQYLFIIYIYCSLFDLISLVSVLKTINLQRLSFGAIQHLADMQVGEHDGKSSLIYLYSPKSQTHVSVGFTICTVCDTLCPSRETL